MDTPNRKPTILLVSRNSDTIELGQELVPHGLNMKVATSGSGDYVNSLPESDYVIGFIASLLTDDFYKAASNLKLVQLLSTGYENVDVEAARRAGVPIANNGGANAHATAEHTILLMLAVSRHLIWQHNSVVTGRWQGINAPRRHELRGKTLGIVGFQAIGRKVAHLASAFGMTVRYYDIARLQELDEVFHRVEFRLFEELLQSSDVVSLHVPLNQATAGLIGRPELQQMKTEAILINTSRGPVVDEQALVEALADGTIAGAGLDVLEQEPPPQDHHLFALENVILTPHLAGPTWESRIAMMRNAFDNIERVERGMAPLWLIPELKGKFAG